MGSKKGHGFKNINFLEISVLFLTSLVMIFGLTNPTVVQADSGESPISKASSVSSTAEVKETDASSSTSETQKAVQTAKTSQSDTPNAVSESTRSSSTTSQKVNVNQSSKRVSDQKVSEQPAETRPVQKSAKLTTHYYLTGTRKQLASDQIQNIAVNTKFTAPVKALTGYKLNKNASQNVTGVMGDTDQISSYFYLAKTEKMKVNYWLSLEDEEFLLDTQIVKGKYGTKYQVKPVDLVDAGLYWIIDDQRMPQNANGYFKEKNQSVNYYYLSDTAKDVVHSDGSETFVVLAANGKIGSIDQTYDEGEELDFEHDQFNKPVYDLYWENEDGDGEYCEVNFGSQLSLKHSKYIYEVQVDQLGGVKIARLVNNQALDFSVLNVSNTGNITAYISEKLANLQYAKANGVLVFVRQNPERVFLFTHNELYLINQGQLENYAVNAKFYNVLLQAMTVATTSKGQNNLPANFTDKKVSTVKASALKQDDEALPQLDESHVENYLILLGFMMLGFALLLILISVKDSKKN